MLHSIDLYPVNSLQKYLTSIHVDGALYKQFTVMISFSHSLFKMYFFVPLPTLPYKDFADTHFTTMICR